MLEFLRKNAVYVGGLIVVAFMVTLFGGAAFFGGSAPDMSQVDGPSVDFSQEIAVLGNKPVSKGKIYDFMSQLQNQAGDIGINPDLIEIIQYNALTSAIRFSILYDGAVENKLKLTSIEKRQGLNNVLVQYDLKDEKALKALLKENNYPYKVFKSNLEQDLVAQKFANQLRSQADITQQDLQNQYTKVDVSHILFRVDPAEPDAALRNAEQVLASINAGLAFETAANTHNDDSAQKNGKIGWIKIGDTHTAFEDAAFAGKKGEILGPIKTGFGYHLIQINDRDINAIPSDVDQNELRDQLLAEKQQRYEDQYLKDFIDQNPLTIFDPFFLAYYEKTQGKPQEAINAYQSQISVTPESPFPHYFIAQIHGLLKEPQKAISELEKAKIKVKINPQLNFPALHLSMGAMYLEAGEFGKKNLAYEAAIDSVKADPRSLGRLVKAFETLKEPLWAAKAKALLPEKPKDA